VGREEALLALPEHGQTGFGIAPLGECPSSVHRGARAEEAVGVPGRLEHPLAPSLGPAGVAQRGRGHHVERVDHDRRQRVVEQPGQLGEAGVTVGRDAAHLVDEDRERAGDDGALEHSRVRHPGGRREHVVLQRDRSGELGGRFVEVARLPQHASDRAVAERPHGRVP
jgi:hypothetical protein